MFVPTLRRVIVAVGVALLGFVLPQRIPLEFDSPGDPSSGLQYLEIACAANRTGLVEIYLDTGRGFNDLESIRWPVTPGTVAYTYTFPLPDAPLRRMRIVPFETGAGKLTIAGSRIINRRGNEVVRFTRADFQRSCQIAAILRAPVGWTIVTTPDATRSYSDIGLGRPLIPEGMNRRNLQRCALSWFFLSLMIWILLLAVHFSLQAGTSRAVGQPRGPRPTVLLFLALLAGLSSGVANRGLIRNSVRYARQASLVEKGPLAPSIRPLPEIHPHQTQPQS
jgi:hypothetical protein